MSLDILAGIVGVGAYTAILPVGAWIADRIVPEGETVLTGERLATVLALGVGAISVYFGIVVLLGHFHPGLNGAVGWLVTALAVRQRLRNHAQASRSRGFCPRLLKASAMTISWAALGLAALGYLYLGFPYESLHGVRDEAIYTLGALALERTGTLALDAPTRFIAVAPDLVFTFFDGANFFAPGIYSTDAGLVLQFSPLPSAWIAQAHATFGDSMLYRTSGALALASVLLFHLIVRRLFIFPVALACTVVFALNPAQVWIARINLSEPLGQLLLLSGLWLSMQAFGRKSHRAAVAAGTLFGLTAFVRLDAVALSLLVSAAAIASTIWGGARMTCHRATFVVLASSTIAAQVIAVGAFARASLPYVASNQTVLWAFAALTLIGMGALAIVKIGAGRSSTALAALAAPSAVRALSWGVAIVLVGLFIYAAWWRPERGPFATLSRPGHILDGQRAFREESVANLAVYLGWPTLLLALAGSVLIAARLFRGRSTPVWFLMWFMFVPVAAITLFDPKISPDHFWAVRRFVLLLIPLTIIFAGAALEMFLLRSFGRRARYYAAGICVAAAIGLLFVQRATLLVRENRGTTVQLRELAALTASARLVVVRDLGGIATTLLVGFGQPVVPLRPSPLVPDAPARAFWSQCSRASPCALVHRDSGGMSELAIGASKTISLRREYIAPTNTPLPSSTAREAISVFVTPVYGLARP